MSIKFLCRLALLAISVVTCAASAQAQARPVSVLESCYASGTIRQLRDNEFSPYSASPVMGGSLGMGCDLFDLKGMPFGTGLTLGGFADVQQTADIRRRSGLSGDWVTKRLGTMGFLGATTEFKLPTFGRVTPSILMRYGVEVGSLVLPRGSYTDASGWEKVFAKRYTQQVGIAGCLDYNAAVKLCAEYSKLTYDTYPHTWYDPNGKQQGHVEAITAANEIVGRLIVPFSSFRM